MNTYRITGNNQEWFIRAKYEVEAAAIFAMQMGMAFFFDGRNLDLVGSDVKYIVELWK